MPRLPSRAFVCSICMSRRHPCISKAIMTNPAQSRSLKSSFTSSHKPIRILMLHGFTQSGPLFHAKTRALEKNLTKALAPHGGVHLHYPTGPITLRPADVIGLYGNEENAAAALGHTQTEHHSEARGWWIRRGQGEPYIYEGIEQGLNTVAKVLSEEGPFDGVIGFSQGGALAGMVGALLEEGDSGTRKKAFETQAALAGTEKGMPYPASFIGDSEVGSTGYIEGDTTIHPPLKFAVSYSGFAASTNPLYAAFYEPKIKTKMLHFLGSVDTVVEEARSLRLVDACAEGRGERGERVVYHPGGHFLPSSQKQYVAILIDFIKETMGLNNRHEVEERAEDMDVPF